MRWRTKWTAAAILTVGILGLSKLEEKEMINQRITHYVSTGADFVEMKKWVASFLEEPDTETILVSHNQNELTAYESMQPYREGVLASYSMPHTIEARESGLVIFTGITRKTGKTMTVLYDDGDSVTYGFVGEFSKLPYTSVKQGETIAVMGEETIYLEVKREGDPIDAALLPAYFSGVNE